MYPETLNSCIEAVFKRIKPRVVVITTPNSEFNIVFDDLPTRGNSKIPRFRHWDHKFEFSRSEFKNWCQTEILNKYSDYILKYEHLGIGIPPSKFENVGMIVDTYFSII